MNKYESDSLQNRNLPQQMGYQQDLQGIVYPGNPALANQRNIAFQQMTPAYTAPAPQQIYFNHVPQMIPGNCYSQIFPNYLSNPFPLQNNYVRQPIMNQQYTRQIDKINQNPQNMLQNMFPYPVFQTQSQQITHQMHHIQPQVAPQMQIPHAQLQQPQISLPCSGSQVPRQYQSNINEKHEKKCLALEIINPETKKSIDLTSFKNDKETKKNKIENLDFKFEKPKFLESFSNQNKNIDFVQPLIPKTEISKSENQINDEKINFIDNKNENKEYLNENIDNIKCNDPILDDDDCIEHKRNTNEISEISFQSSFSTPLNEPSKPVVHSNTSESEIISEEMQINLQNNDVIDANDVNNIIIIKPQDIQYTEDSKTNIDKNFNKYIYSRDDLIKIGKNNLSRQKPKGLQFREDFTESIILDCSSNVSSFENIESMHSMTQKSIKVPKGSQCTYYSWRPPNSKNIHNFPKYINLGNTENVLLRSDDGYVTCKQRLAAGEELSETEELVRQIKGILNRIVPQNFDQCLDDLVSLKIGTYEGMTCLVNELFLKAVKEEAYSVTFAKICSYLASIRADVSDHEIVTFKSVLLQKCQAMFTTPLEEQLETVRQDWLLKASTEKPKTKLLMESDVEEQIKKAKDRYYGNIRFIGELYLKGVLITKIICFCIENLLTKENDSDSLICLCKLLETCGAKLETEAKGKEKLNDSFKKLRQLCNSINVETRVRFRILDIMEMREKKWCLRKVQQEQKIEPKTLEEIKIEKELEEEKEYISNINRKNLNNWGGDRRSSLPNVNKTRSNFLPKQLTVSNPTNDSTTLGPQKRNWVAGSGAAISSQSVDSEKNRMNKAKGKLNVENRSKDSNNTFENSESNQIVEGCVSNSDNICIPPNHFSGISYPSANSSENSSRSSSHGRSTPQTILKEKLPDSKLAQTDVVLLSPIELFTEYARTNNFCEDSWNACSDKVEVVYQWLDSHFETSCDKRNTLSHLLSTLINENRMDKNNLLKAFTKLIDSLEDLIIDIGQSIWDSLSDYFIPFLESTEMDSIDLIGSIFDFEVLNKFEEKHACIFYSLPWSMINKILKSPKSNYGDIFKLAVTPENSEQLSLCEQQQISIVSKNLSRAINIVTQLNTDFYIKWIDLHDAESFNCYGKQFFLLQNWEVLLNQINLLPTCRCTEYLKKLSSMSKNNEVRTALCKICDCNNQTSEGISSIIRCLIETNTYDLQTILNWDSNSDTCHVPSKLKDVLIFYECNSAFNSDNSFRYLDGSNNSFNESSLDHDNCTKSDSY